MRRSEQRLSDDQLQTQFLEAWPIETIRKISIDQYVNIGKQNTFCQYVETITRPLGSIKGMNSIKFGIYKRRDPAARPRHVISNDTHSWSPRFDRGGSDELEVFKEVIEEIHTIASYASEGYFEAISYLKLPSIFRWKVASLYSHGRLIPIFSIENLRAIVSSLGMERLNNKTTYWQMQQFLIVQKPLGITSVEFMRMLYEKFRRSDDDPGNKPSRRRTRKGVKSKKLLPVRRRGSAGGMTDPLHNIIQQRLYEHLCIEYTEECVSMERDWIDLMVELEDRMILYEVKPDTFAEKCFKHALGQLMLYAYHAEMHYPGKVIELVIVGPNGPTREEILLLDFISQKVNFPISYKHIDRPVT